MNHFFAIELSPEARRAVAGAAREWARLLAPAQRARWYGPDDFHITLKFLGDLPPAARPDLAAAAAPVAAASEPFEVGLAGAGAFPGLHRPSVLWVGVRTSAPLAALAARLDGALAARGYAPERRPYRPHVTVARCRPGGAGEWPRPSERLFPSWRAARFVLMQTLPPEGRAKGGGARYNVVHPFPLGGTP
jgi:2'-5' RNA ligase